VSWQHIYGVSWLAGIGFTMSLFITGLAFHEPELVISAKFAILLASLTAGIVGWFILRVITEIPIK
jgi:NhaA family Na+:H+ antiporter